MTDSHQTNAYWSDAEIFGYKRKSLVLGEEDRISEVKQHDAIVAECRRLPLPCPAEDHWFADVDGHRSGRYEHTRPEWRRMKARLLAAPKAVLIVYELDRSNRNVKAMAELIETFRTQPARFRLILIQNRFDSALHGWGAREIKNLHQDAADAQYESDKAAERMSATIRVLKSHKVPWGTTPYGLLRDGRGLKAKWIKGKQADDIIFILDRWVEPGQSYQSIATTLNATNRYYWKPARDRAGNRYELPQRWTSDRVRQIVANVLVYAGYLMPRGGHARTRHPRLQGDGTLIERHARAYDAERVPAIEALISAEMAERIITKKLSVEHRGRKPVRGWHAWLTPLLTYNGQKIRAQRMHGINYYCTRGRNRTSWHADDVDEELLANLRGVRFPPMVIERIEQLIDARTGAAERQRLKSTIEQMREALLNLERKSALGHFDSSQDTYLQLREEFTVQMHAAERKLFALAGVGQVMAKLADLGATIDTMSPGQRIHALRALFESIELSDQMGILRITPREWARHAFGELVWAWKHLQPVLPKVTPTGLQAELGNTAWLIERLAACSLAAA